MTVLCHLYGIKKFKQDDFKSKNSPTMKKSVEITVQKFESSVKRWSKIPAINPKCKNKCFDIINTICSSEIQFENEEKDEDFFHTERKTVRGLKAEFQICIQIILDQKLQQVEVVPKQPKVAKNESSRPTLFG